MKTIKIIDLLNKIANGEEVPKKIKYLNAIYIYNKETKQYYKLDNNYVDTILTKSLRAVLINFDRLNDEVEIIEEKKLPEKLDDMLYEINEILDYLESKEKGE